MSLGKTILRQKFCHRCRTGIGQSGPGGQGRDGGWAGQSLGGECSYIKMCVGIPDFSREVQDFSLYVLDFFLAPQVCDTKYYW